MFFHIVQSLLQSNKKTSLLMCNTALFFEKLSFQSDVIPARLSAWCPSVRPSVCLFYHFGMNPVFFQPQLSTNGTEVTAAERRHPIQSHRDRGQTSWLRRTKWVEPCYQLGGRGRLCLSPVDVKMMTHPLCFLFFFGFPLQSHSKLIETDTLMLVLISLFFFFKFIFFFLSFYIF